MHDESKPVNGPYDMLWLTASFLVLLLLGLRTVSGADIWLHLAAGRFAAAHGAASLDPFSFGLPPGTAWIQSTWLYDLMVYKLWAAGGSALVILAHTAAVAAAFLGLLSLVRSEAGQMSQAAALLLSAWLLAPLFTLRPIVFCLLFIALSMRLLSRSRLGWFEVTALVFIQILWANMHPTFLLGILFAGIRAWEAASLRRKPSPTMPPTETAPLRLAGLAVALAAVSLLNPAGPTAFREAVTILTRPEGSVMLEWISMFNRDFLPFPTGMLTTLGLILIAVVFIFFRGRLPALPTLGAIVSAFLMVRSNHTLELCAVLAFPFFTLGFSVIGRLVSRLQQATWYNGLVKGSYAGLALLLIFSGWLVMTNRYYAASGSASAFGLRVNTDAYPLGALTFLKDQHELPPRTLNIAHDGGFLLWHRPGHQVFTDPRGNLYGGIFYQRLAKGLLGNDMHWKELVTRYDPEGVLLNATWTGAGTVVYHLVSRGQWAIAYFDGTTVLMVRKTSGNRALMEDRDLQLKGLQLIDAALERYQRSLSHPAVRPPNPSRLIGASAVLQALGRYEEALKVLTPLTEGAPRMVSAWVNRGIAEQSLGRSSDAVRSLETSIRLLPSNPIALLWLGEAYRADGREKDAEAVDRKAAEINPGIVEIFRKEREAMMFQAPKE